MIEPTTATDAISLLLQQHGSMALFVLLALGIVGLPLPDETILVAAGFLLTRGKLYLPSTLTAAYLGSICGITMSYMIGCTAGSFLVKKYGSWLGVNEKRLAFARHWFDRIGMWALFFGYFVPGVRHVTGYLAGTLRVAYQRFALFAYLGAIFWVSLFLSIGYFLGR